MRTIEEVVFKAQRTIQQNQECFMAQWILQNADKNVDDYVIVTQFNWSAGENRFWVEKK